MSGAILARKQTTCAGCQNPIMPGEPIEEVGAGLPHAGKWVHEECVPEPGFDDDAFVARLNGESQR